MVKPPPNGRGLRKHFLRQLHLDPDTDYELQVLAEEFASESETDLYHELYNLFQIDKSGPNQQAILRERWLRIYTTNYDNTVEVCRKSFRMEDTAYNSSDPVPNRIQTNCVVHLHGSIDRLKADNVLEQLVLGETSYVKQYIQKSPWYTQFQSDMKFASNIFIIGYSLSDYHISALLLENPLLAERTFFIQSTSPDSLFERRTQKYGKALFIGAEGFAELLKTVPRAKPLLDLKGLKSFRALDPQRDKKGLRSPTAKEVFNLLVYGTFNYSRCAATLPDETYVIRRSKEINEFLDLIEKSRSVIVDGRMGNGKTVFLHLAFLALAEREYSCFMYRSAGPMFEQELDAIALAKKPVILFDEYASSQDVIQKIAEKLPTAKFIIEIRTSILEVRYHEVSGGIPKPYKRVSVNRLSGSDVGAFVRLCERSGISSLNLPTNIRTVEMRELLIILLNSQNIKDKINATVRPIFESLPRKRVLIIATLLAKFHISADAGFIRGVTGVDPYHEFSQFKEIVDEIFETVVEDFCVRSAVFSDFAMQNVLEAGDIGDCIVEAALAS